MTQPSPAGTGARRIEIPRSVIIATCLVFAIIGAGIVSLTVAQKVFSVIVDKPPAQLSKPLADLAKSFGENNRYVATGPDRTLDKEIVAVLGTEDYLLRNYRDALKHDGDLGREIALNLNFYATGSATPHVPEICWAGNGLNLQSSRFFDIQGIRHKDGTQSDIRVRLLSFTPKAQPGAITFEGLTPSNQLLNVAYVFNVNGRYVANTGEVRKHFWDPQAKYAYHTKIEVTVPMVCSPEEAQPLVEEFFRNSLAEIEKCLPDPDSLADQANTTQEAK